MEENAQLRVDKMLQSTTRQAAVSPRSPSSGNTTNFITQNVHNYIKTDELNLYSTVNNTKKQINSPPGASASATGIDMIYPGQVNALTTNRLRDNYFIKLENSEGQRSLNGNEFMVRKMKKQANGSESGLASKTKDKHHGEK
jgi:hypothetical protein